MLTTAIPAHALVPRTLPLNGERSVAGAALLQRDTGPDSDKIRYHSVHSTKDDAGTIGYIYTGHIDAKTADRMPLKPDNDLKVGEEMTTVIRDAMRALQHIGTDVPNSVFDTAQGVEQLLTSLPKDHGIVQLMADNKLVTRLITNDDAQALAPYVFGIFK